MSVNILLVSVVVRLQGKATSLLSEANKKLQITENKLLKERRVVTAMLRRVSKNCPFWLTF